MMMGVIASQGSADAAPVGDSRFLVRSSITVMMITMASHIPTPDARRPNVLHHKYIQLESTHY
jgi:hypothetical protein